MGPKTHNNEFLEVLVIYGNNDKDNVRAVSLHRFFFVCGFDLMSCKSDPLCFHDVTSDSVDPRSY
jgi:hypothetical protein